MDLMLELIARRHGRILRSGSRPVRAGADSSAEELAARGACGTLWVNNTKLLSAIAQMEQHIETPLAIDPLARNVNVTRRQLERLFQASMGESPAGSIELAAGTRESNAATN